MFATTEHDLLICLQLTMFGKICIEDYFVSITISGNDVSPVFTTCLPRFLRILTPHALPGNSQKMDASTARLLGGASPRRAERIAPEIVSGYVTDAAI